MNKRKVATTSTKVSLKRDRINEWLVSHPEGATPKMIATGTSLNVNTVKSILPKLDNITQITRGWYKVVNGGYPPSASGGTLLTWNFHNLRLTFPVENQSEQDHSLTFGLININIHVNKSGNCNAVVSTDHPINVSSICLVHGFLEAYFQHPISMHKISITSIEFNKDNCNTILEGIKSIKLDTLCSRFKLYQKSIGLRVEHKTKVPFTVNNMVDMLSHPPNTLDLSTKLSHTQSQLCKLTAQSVYNTQQLNKLMEGMK